MPCGGTRSKHDPFVDLVPPQGIRLTPRHYAYLKISEGCNNKCSFCIIPSMRGLLVSRPIDEVLRETFVVVPAYNEARVIGEHFRDGTPVIMNLTEMDHADAKRLVDFAAGLIFCCRGSIERITTKVFLVCPPNVTVAAEEKEKIAADGFYNQS